LIGDFDSRIKLSHSRLSGRIAAARRLRSRIIAECNVETGGG